MASVGLHLLLAITCGADVLCPLTPVAGVFASMFADRLSKGKPLDFSQVGHVFFSLFFSFVLFVFYIILVVWT